jgi:hypothetical protein
VTGGLLDVADERVDQARHQRDRGVVALGGERLVSLKGVQEVLLMNAHIQIL